MITEVTMPSMGADMTEGTIVKWLKAEGDAVARGDKLAEIETDKTVVEMEAYANGLLRKIVVAEGGKGTGWRAYRLHRGCGRRGPGTTGTRLQRLRRRPRRPQRPLVRSLRP